MNIQLQIIPVSLLPEYLKQVEDGVEHRFEALHDSELSIKSFDFYTSVSAVFSSKIEGEEIELDSYIKHKRLGAHFLPDYTRKIDDLYEAYMLARQNDLIPKNLERTHAIITRHILRKPQQGKMRKGNMFVITKDGRIEYAAAAPELVKPEMKKLYADVAVLLQAELTFKEVLFFASLIHLVFLKIHPFEDGNGRTSRLLEKWFIARKLGGNAWYLETEKYYYQQYEVYYKNIRSIGLEYQELDYNKALPFLMMLVEAI